MPKNPVDELNEAIVLLEEYIEQDLELMQGGKKDPTLFGRVQSFILENNLNYSNQTNLTYLDLLRKCASLTPEQLQMNVSVFNSETSKYHPVTGCKMSDEENDVLDEGHPYIVI